MCQDSGVVTPTNINSDNIPQPYVPPSKTERVNTKPYLKAIEEYRKLCLKTYSTPNQTFANILKSDQLNIFLDTYTLQEILVMNKLIGKYFYFKHIVLSPFDPNKGNPNEKKKRGFGIETPLTPSEREKAEKDKKEQQYAKGQKIYHIVQGIAKNLCLSSNVLTFSLNGLTLSQELTSFLSVGIIENKSLQGLSITNCNLPIDSYEILLKGVLTHEKIEFLNLSSNNFGDKYGNMIGRIIARQTQRRDQVIWAYGLRNEKPLTNDYTKGLISINLSNNNLGDISADNISNALSYDQYIRNVDLSGNNFSKESCKRFIHMLRKNFSILTMDLKENPGYDPEIHARMVMKMSKNIRYLYQMYQDEKIEAEEFEYLKSFIDVSFFDFEIPEEMAEMYNVQSNELTNGNEEEGEEEEEEKKEGEQPQDENEGEEEAEKKVNNENSNKSPQKQENNEIDNNSDLKEVNKQLLAENLKYKKELLSMRAKLIQEHINSSENEGEAKVSPSSIEANYYKIVKLLNELNGLMDDVETTMRNEKQNEKPMSIEEHKEDSVQKNPKESEGEVEVEEKYHYQEMQAEPSEEPSENEKRKNKELFENDDDEEEEEEEDENLKIQQKLPDKKIRNEMYNDEEEDEFEYEYEYDQGPKMNKSF